MKPLVKPFVNINGKERKDLVSEHAAVAEAAKTLLEALRQAAPHGRDFQTAPTTNAFPDARDAFFERYAIVDGIRAEYQRMAYTLYQEGGPE